MRMMSSACPWGSNTLQQRRSQRQHCLLELRARRGLPVGHECPHGRDLQRAGGLVGVHAHKHGCPWTSEVAAAAAGFDSIACLRYAHENGCPWDEGTCAREANAGALECLAYAHENGCPGMKPPAERRSTAMPWKCFAYAYDSGCPWDNGSLLMEGPGGQWNVFNSGLTVVAVQGHSLPCLAYARNVMECARDLLGTECQVASKTAQLDMLRYVRSHGGVWPKDIRSLCPNLGSWLDSDDAQDRRRKAECLLYMYCCGGCRLPTVSHTAVGREMLDLLEARRLAVLQCFHPSAAVRSGTRAVCAVMQIAPSDLVKEFVHAANLQAPQQKAPLRRQRKVPRRRLIV